MRDKLIDIILTAQGFKEVGTVAEGYEAVYAAEVAARKAQAGKIADALLAAGVVQEWVSVKDALPERGERVLTTDGAFVGEMYINARGQWQRYNVNHHALLMALDILYWMPLPAPPKEE